MNVPNHEKKAFRDMTPEERRAIVEAWLSGNAEYFSMVEDEWAEKMKHSTLVPSTIYRTRPRQLVIPWEHIKPECKWAAMDADGEVYLYPEKPEDDCDQWLPVEDDAIKANDVLDIDTAGIDWRDSLVQRPEGV